MQLKRNERGTAFINALGTRNELCRLLKISPPTLRAKLLGTTPWTEIDIALLSRVSKCFSRTEVYQILTAVEEGESSNPDLSQIVYNAIAKYFSQTTIKIGG